MLLNEEQKAVVYANEDKILCLAGAGTGKTHCMISRILRLVDEGVDPSSILVLTFTNAAAFEMKDRYKKQNESRFTPEFRTFHSFCYYLISINKSLRLELGYNDIPEIATEGVNKKVLKETEMQLGFHISDKKLSGKEVLSWDDQFKIDLLNKAYKRSMRSKNLITFDTLCYGVCKLFTENHPVVSSYKEKYKYIFVDEFQDTDPKQYQFIRSFKDSKLFVVGDALQAIYAFRGADSSIIKNIAEDSNWTTYRLTHNYRSTSSICQFANKNTRYARDSYRICIESDKGGGTVSEDISRYGFTRRGVINDKAVIDRLTKFSELPGYTAILCRTNAEADFIKSNFSYSDEKSEIAKDAVNILKSACDDNFALDWISSFLPSEKYAEYLRQSYVSRKMNTYTLDMFSNVFSDSYEVCERLQKIYRVRQICSQRDASEQMKLDVIFAVLHMEGIQDSIQSDPENVDSFEHLISALEDHLSNNIEESNLYIGTIHSSKGLEYDNVAVVGVNGASFQLTNEENNNVYYVAITRAKTNLLVIRGN